ncbi:MAG: 50S ribosomal protein L6 [Candidatus Tagabacteria bacterium CG09_land_8_20_14_0_10_41_14]|uniref:Large ribosomal subunit protein uL6 n=2 Tax=Candidatus Tagaibacteriota TaxID=1817918 RepID=A0A2H0WLH5_9BACT|nr:MAG: 50S ribosomal protein L6 [Candidatus Tagabacteria bacterium CG09_land_8_20_14_0_10_41_14]PJE73130.1 MAG: 50S ribosomal protein L6 [Candidatus Tagabacteria bacterium CG10_big_fil_rev_8_21_14_0_10_40_13]
MSRLGKKPITIPEGVDVKIENGRVEVKGPKGELSRVFKDAILLKKTELGIELSPRKNNAEDTALWGTYASHIKNMIKGVVDGFSKKLIIEGVGFKSQVKEEKLVLSLGFSHPIEMDIPKGIQITSEKNNIEVSGIDKELVGQTAASIRAFKKPEPYKGKGIRYEDEVIRRKAGKKAAGTV